MLKKLKKEARCLIITSAFLGLVFLVLLIVSLVTHKYGIVIGWSIGFAITIFSMFLLFKSGELIQKNATSDNPKGTGLVILFYASRFALYAIGLVFCALAFYTWKCKHFEYALFTCLCALLPSHLFIAILYHDGNDEPKKIVDTKVEETKKEEVNK